VGDVLILFCVLIVVWLAIMSGILTCQTTSSHVYVEQSSHASSHAVRQAIGERQVATSRQVAVVSIEALGARWIKTHPASGSVYEQTSFSIMSGQSNCIVILPLFCSCFFSAQLLENMESKMKGTCVDGIIPKLFEGRMLVGFPELIRFTSLNIKDKSNILFINNVPQSIYCNNVVSFLFGRAIEMQSKISS